MKPASPALMDVLGGSQFFMADCYGFALLDGTVARYTSAEIDLVDPATGHVFTAGGPYFERSKVKFSRGVQVDELEIVVTAKPTDLLDGAGWFAALTAGILDGAEIQLDRAFMPRFGDTEAGLVTLFAGRVTEIDLGRTRATIRANTHLELLNLQWPWRLFQPGCARTLFDAGCGLAKSGFATACHVVAGSTIAVLQTDYALASGTATLGTLTFSSGALTGKSYGIRQQTGGAVTLTTPLPALPGLGDGVMLYPGCDKTQATCKAKFANLRNFAGFPYIPSPETAA